jgi:hypothetical protein
MSPIYGARHQDLLIDWPSVVMWLWLWDGMPRRRVKWWRVGELSGRGVNYESRLRRISAHCSEFEIRVKLRFVLGRNCRIERVYMTRTNEASCYIESLGRQKLSGWTIGRSHWVFCVVGCYTGHWGDCLVGGFNQESYSEWVVLVNGDKKWWTVHKLQPPHAPQDCSWSVYPDKDGGRHGAWALRILG